MSSNTSNPRVSLLVEIPEELHEALQAYVDTRPAWSQHRVFCAALSMFLMQNSGSDGAGRPGAGSPPSKRQRQCDVSRIYLDTLFDYVH